jgi:hypothetical protein
VTDNFARADFVGKADAYFAAKRAAAPAWRTSIDRASRA